jgi:hypothetical protein
LHRHAGPAALVSASWPAQLASPCLRQAGSTCALADWLAQGIDGLPAAGLAAAKEQADQALQRFADGFSWLRRAPVLHSPSEHGLVYEDVTFPASDGVPLEGWFIPAPGSGTLIIANHPMGFSRSGMPTHYEPWHADWAASGNGFEVDLVPDYKILHDAGYNVLAYDLRNHGLSSAANGGVSTHGITEWRDIVGSLDYARTRPGAGDMTIGLFSRCMLAVMGLGGRLDDFNTLVRLRTSVGLEQRVPQEWARNVRVPTFLYQVRGDILTHPCDVQAMFDNIPVAEKQLQWIEGTTARWDGYLEFQRRPQPMLDWFAHYMS